MAYEVLEPDYLGNPNVSRFLNMIGMSEGTVKPGVDAYRVGFGGSDIADLSAHPNIRVPFTQTDGRENVTTAAGKYQFLKGTWDDVSRKLGLQDFSPRSQDLAAIELLRRNGALQDVVKGDFNAAIKKSGSTWASLPSSPYAQPKRSAGFVARALDAAIPSAQASTDMSSGRFEVLDDAPKGRFEVLSPGDETVKAAGGAINSAIREVPRQLGLTARYALEGPAQALQIFTEPIAGLMRMTGLNVAPLGETASGIADWAGLPSPANATERVVGDITRTVAGAAASARGGGLLSKVPGVVGQVGRMFSAAPVQQLGAAAGAGGAGGLSREAGGSELEQGLAAVVGGVAGGLAASGLQALSGVAKRAVSPKLTPQQLDMRINIALERGGIDPATIPSNVRAGLRSELAGALQAGKELDANAVARLADFKTVGLTPTRGTVTLDPVQITREANLAKMGANSADGGLQGLARIQNENNAKLIDTLNGAGGRTGDPFRAGETAINSIVSRDEALRQNVTSLYNQARSMPGGDIPLDRASFVNAIYDRLAKENKLNYLPDNISNMLNTISTGQIQRNGQTFQVPFTANTLDNLMTDIATASRSSNDGNVRAALKLARDAIDGVQVQPIKQGFGGNQLVTSAGADFLRAQDAAAGQFMDALNTARGAARNRFSWQESSRPVQAALGGAQPDDFIRKFVINGSVADAEAVARNFSAQQPGRALVFPGQAMPATTTQHTTPIRDAIVSHLKDRALNGASDEVGKFSQSAFNKALKQIGDRKLALFFSPEEIAQLKAVGRVASYTQAQPIGSAVNNSNSGALLLGRGIDALDKIPVLGPMFGQPVRNIVASVQQSSATNVTPGLLGTAPQANFAERMGLLPGALVSTGGLLSAAPIRD